jgi:hypothetical protein
MSTLKQEDNLIHKIYTTNYYQIYNFIVWKLKKLYF